MSEGAGRGPRAGGAGEPAPARLEAGPLRTLITPSGTGGTWAGDYALTRWREDAVEDALGWRFQVGDPAGGVFWPIGRAGPADRPARLEFGAAPDAAAIVRTEAGIEARLDVRLDPGGAFEARRVTLRNVSGRARTLELTSLLEVSLQHPAADAAHPAFSKLFVQTSYDPAHRALLARRRPRASDERHPWMLLAAPGTDGLEWETDRARYLGRGDLAHERARMSAPGTLAGVTGNVLDPVFAVRRRVELAARAEVVLDFVLVAAPDRDAALALAASLDAVRLGALFEPGARPALQAVPAAGAATPRFTPVDGCDGGVPEAHEALRFENGAGGFSEDGQEYVIRVRGRDAAGRPPKPWVNVIANERMGFLVSESGAASSWGGNSHEYRLTPWSNDPVLDPCGEALYVRDEDAGTFWSPQPGPVACGGDHEVRHAPGETAFRHVHADIEHETRLFVAREDPVRFCRVRLVNRSPRTRRLSLWSYQRLVLGVLPGPALATSRDTATGALFAAAPAAGPFAGRVAFAAMVAPEDAAAVDWTTDRAGFLGVPGDPRRPAALTEDTGLDRAAGDTGEPCFVMAAPIVLAPGEETERIFLLGDAADAAEARTLVERYPTPASVERARAEALGFWTKLVSGVRIETPEPAIDLMVNTWLPYQALSGRMLGRTAFYQSSGAYGFRDQLQDSSSFAMLDPALFRRQILLHASHQFVEGDVLHWWHPPHDRGMRTRFADDLLWLPYLAAEYVAATGDASVLDERCPFLTARALEPGEAEAFVEPRAAGRSADVYTHACLAIDRSLVTGAHGLPLFGSGDWNDGMNRVGHEGRGESVWMAFFLIAVLDAFVPLCEARGEQPRAEKYRKHARALQRAIEAHAWDGDWYLRAWDDDGLPLGTHTDDECMIDGLVQAWSVISGAAPAARTAQALDAVERHLVSESDGIIRLLTPPFEDTPRDPGYIRGYVKGVRENGGQYTHAALWIVRAFAEAGRRDRAAALLAMISPVHHTASASAVARYQVEPYVIAADVYGAPPHVGRGGWTWYTGSASWMYRVALESVLGVEWRRGNTLRLRSRIPDAWPSCRVEWRVPGSATAYRIAFERSAPGGIRAASLDGQPLEVKDGEVHVPLARDERVHQVTVMLGKANSSGANGAAKRQEPAAAPARWGAGERT